MFRRNRSRISAQLVSAVSRAQAAKLIEALEPRQLLSAAALSAATPAAASRAISGTVFDDLNHNGVRDAGEPGVANVVVYQDPNYNHEWQSDEQYAVTDSSGNYVFANPPADPEILRIELPSGAQQTFPANGAGDYVGKNTGPLTNENFGITLPAPPNASISGKVLVDSNNNGVIDSGDKGLAGIEVFLDLADRSSYFPGDPYAITDANGAYTITNVEPGTYILADTPPAHYAEIIPKDGNQIIVTAVAAQNTPGQNFLLNPPATTGETISGTVFDDVNKDGVQDNGETGRPGVVVYLDPNYNHKADPGEQSVVTDANGHYTFTNVPADPEIVRIVLPSGATQTSPANGAGIYVGKNTGATLTNENFGVFAPGTITGYVYNDINMNGIVDPGEGIAGVKVFPQGNPNNFVITNSLGFYALTGLSPGSYDIMETTPAGYTQVTPAAGQGDTVVLSYGSYAEGQSFILSTSAATTGSISGTVFNDSNHDGVQDDGEKGIAGVKVYLDPNYNHTIDTNEQTAVTDANGFYIFTNPPADPEIVRIILPTGAQQTSPANGAGNYVGKPGGMTLTGENFGVFTPAI